MLVPVLLLLFQATPAPCSGCHAGIAARHSKSNHAHALTRFDQSPDAANFFKASGITERDAATYEYSPGRGFAELITRMGAATVSARLEWLFGAGAQGQTPVGRDARGRYFEHRLSFYRRQDRLGRTFGHPQKAPSDVNAALGLINGSQTIFRCFHCHAENVKPGPALDEIRPGVTCERCHGTGDTHRLRPAAKILNPRRFAAKESVLFCAECHRSPSQSEESPEIVDPVSVRFAPVGLTASRCFTVSRNLSCLTCHDPHINARPRTDVAFYKKVCVGCHASTQTMVARRRTTTACPRATQDDCVSCHMPSVALTPYLTFTDHRIRIPAR